jgi:L-threonylcarbamoyladenylate synthase
VLGESGELGILGGAGEDLGVARGCRTAAFALERARDDGGAARLGAGADDIVDEVDQLLGEPDRDLLAHPIMVAFWYEMEPVLGLGPSASPGSGAVRVTTQTLGVGDARGLRECIADGGVAVFPADTVYGLACDPLQRGAVERLYELKGRPPERPAAVMFFSLVAALEALPELAARERAALEALLPGPLTVLLPNREDCFPLACRPLSAMSGAARGAADEGPSAGGEGALGLRVPALPERLAALRDVDVPVLQSSANLSGGPEARRVADIPRALREGADLVLDGGELPGVASTVLDLREYEARRRWHVVRAGPFGRAEVERALG